MRPPKKKKLKGKKKRERETAEGQWVVWMGLESGVEKAMAPHSSTLAWKIHGQRSLVGCSSWDREELDTTEQLHFHFSLSCIGEGNGNLLQYSCLENPRDGGAWWTAVYGVAQSQTRLRQLSSSSSRVWSGSIDLILCPHAWRSDNSSLSRYSLRNVYCSIV